MTYHCWHWPWPPSWGSVSSLVPEYLAPAFAHCTLCKEVLCTAHICGEGCVVLFLEGEIMELFCKGELPLLPSTCLCNHLFVSVWMQEYFFYTSGYAPIYIFLNPIVLSSVPQMILALSAAPSSLWRTLLCLLFHLCEPFLNLWQHRVLQVNLVYFLSWF